ncbi:MAG: hypothetical protein KKA42_05485 [candidate division Zixibacteria bacterium]|nr:hypothetical protein [candidate division Zixibacteria bacterium]
MTQIRTRIVRIAVLSLSLTTLCLVSCGTREDQVGKPPKGVDPLVWLQQDSCYAEWDIFTHSYVRILHPPDHPLKDHLDKHANGYIFATGRIMEQLGLPPFPDTLNVVYFTGFGQGREITGREYPFTENGIVYYWQPGYPGMSLTDHLLTYWTDKKPTHTFLRHGFRALWDFGGRNYYTEMARKMDSGLVIDLIDLAVDTAMNSDTERVQSGEAAAFVAYLLQVHGPDKLKELYESSGDFAADVERIYGLPVATLQRNWLAYIRMNLPPVGLPKDIAPDTGR